MGDIVSKAKLYVDHSGGNFQVKRVESCEIAFEHDLTIITAVGVDGGAGYRAQTGGGELTLEVYPETGKAEVDYLKLFFTRELFRWTMQEEDGARFQCRYCR